ncbi:RNA polymerase sigma factor [Sphingobium lactosutens]|nr:sigma-70 family RNA polymerase sigma factor [Sphingobium lactosutens]
MLIAERPSLVRRLARLLGSEPAAEDLTQNLYFKVQRVEDDPPILNKRAFLHRLATNLAMDWLRAEKRNYALFDVIAPVPDVACEAPLADRQMLDREQLERLLAGVEELTPRCRQVFLMRKFEELPVNEISRRLGITRSMVARHMDNALRHLLARIQETDE